MYKLGLRVLGLVLLLSLSPAAQAQSIWDNEEDEQTVNPGEFELNSGEDGINMYDGTSIYGNSIGGNIYQYKKNSSHSELDYDLNGTASVRELDIEVHKNQGSGNGAYGGGYSSGGYSNNSPSSGNTNIGTSAGGQAQIKHFDNSLDQPFVPGDADAPIDGGLSLLVGAGVAFGVKKIKKKKNIEEAGM